MTAVDDAEFDGISKDMMKMAELIDRQSKAIEGMREDVYGVVKKAGQLVDLTIKGAAGVSNPAHGQPGWAVLKSADSAPAASTMPATRWGAVDRIDDLVKARSRSTGESFVKAYANVLATPEGEALYNAHDVAPPESSGPAVERRAVEKSAVQLEQEDLEHYSKAAFPGLPPLQATTAWLATPAGEAWYNRRYATS